MYSSQSRQGGRAAPLDKWFGSVFEGLWIPRPSVILTFKYTHLIPNIVPPFMTLVSGDRIYVSPMDTLGLLLNFMAISILIQSWFTGMIFFFVFASSSSPSLFLYPSLFHPFPFSKDKVPLCGPGCLWTHDPLALALPGRVYGDKLVIQAEAKDNSNKGSRLKPAQGWDGRHCLWAGSAFPLAPLCLHCRPPFSSFKRNRNSSYRWNRADGNVRVWKWRKINAS